MMKKCFKCKLEKDSSEFNKLHNSKTGLQVYCKLCRQDYRHSFSGHLRILYQSMKHRCLNDPSYLKRKIHFSINEFIRFGLGNQQYKTIHDQWTQSNYQFKLSPSIDRINNNNDYTLGNIQFLSISKNSAKFCGEEPPQSKLKTKDIPLIKNLQGKLNDIEIGVLFGVHRRTISDVRRNKTWKHVA